MALCEKAAPTGEGHSRRRRAAAKPPRGQETGASGASLCAAHGGLRENRAIMLRLPRAAHYSICEKLCARELARLSKTASQWSRAGDPRFVAFFACLADRVARARGIASLSPPASSPKPLGAGPRQHAPRDETVTPPPPVLDQPCNSRHEGPGEKSNLKLVALPSPAAARPTCRR